MAFFHLDHGRGSLTEKVLRGREVGPWVEVEEEIGSYGYD
jgi:hypothetical protein